MSEFRTGIGFDAHPTDSSRPLYLGGIYFPDEPGLAGHSDADVICHALADALLGAAALGDVGEHFPDDDPTTEGIAGGKLLVRVVGLLAAAGFAPVSCDVTVIAERPKIAVRRDEIRSSLAGMLAIPAEKVSVKASRPEGLGLAGDGAGCLAVAVVSGT